MLFNKDKYKTQTPFPMNSDWPYIDTVIIWESISKDRELELILFLHHHLIYLMLLIMKELFRMKIESLEETEF